MKCKKCATEFNGNFCPRCGSPAQVWNAATNSQPNQQTDKHHCMKCGKKGLFVKVNDAGLCPECAAQETQSLKRQLAELNTPEYQNIEILRNKIQQLEIEQNRLQFHLNQRHIELSALETQIQEKKKDLVILDEEILMQDFGLYKPQYDFATSDQYKIKLTFIRNKQKQLIKNGTAVTGNMNWTVNGNSKQGKKMVKDMQQLLLRAFNSECDELVSKVKFNNFDKFVDRMNNSFFKISELGDMMGVGITVDYFSCKLDELQLSYEYQMKKQEEKEEQKRIREELREQAKLAKEIEEAKKNIIKDQQHYTNALEKLKVQIDNESDEQKKSDLLAKQAAMEAKLDELDKEMKDVDYREANQKAGYVYIISNIGAFGENIYKIGMTRRLDPMDRINELGDASVPFNFDVHAMIFTEDAPALENALHHAFEDRKVNMINTRREFFNVTLQEIEAVVKANFDKTVEFVEIPEAAQYRQSVKIRESK